MARNIEIRRNRIGIVPPTCQQFGCCLYILFGELGTGSLADGKKLLDFPCIVFIRCGLDVILPIQVNQHGRIQRNSLEQLLEVSQGLLSQQIVVLVYILGIAHIIGFRGKMIVPEQGHLFPKASVLLYHGTYPPFFKRSPS